MIKKMMTVLLVLAFICSSLLFASSCAKKQIGGQDTGAPTTVAPAPPSKAPSTVTPSRPSAPSSPAPKPQAGPAAPDQSRFTAAKMEFESQNIYFDYDKSELKYEARVTLTNKAAFLRANPGYSVEISGHCDERGTNEYNLALGERRAAAAFKFMNALGVSAARMKTISYGEEKPVDRGHNETAWSKNRRDEFRLMQ